MNFASVCHLLEVWVQQGLRHAVVSAGSRSAPLALAVARHPSITVTVQNDERSAAFVALGMAQAAKQPIVLICTSGTAGLNYSPAVAEAYYQELPLLVCTADRPAEWIDQWDGQTIDQTNLFGTRVLASYSLPVDTMHPDANWHVNRIANEAWWASLGANGGSIGVVAGPVHLNFPFREPFYPAPDQHPSLSEVRVVQQTSNKPLLGKYLAHDLVNHWLATERKLIVVGQGVYQHELNNALYAAQLYSGAPLVADIISNSSQVRDVISHHDLFLMDADPDLAPDLLVTVGKSVMSKNLKLAMRGWKPKQHWHIETTGYVADVYQTLTHIIRTDPVEFFTRVGEQAFFSGNQESPNPYYKAWQSAEAKAVATLDGFLNDANQPLTDLGVAKAVLHQLPDGWQVHLANSMSVRYANFIGLKQGNRNLVFANRGTSGIDGCSSTALGYAIASGEPTLLLTGDVGFFYDRNAFWQAKLPSNLKVVLLNNAGGNIFRMIDGPAQQPELGDLFETWQGHTAALLAQQVGCQYAAVHTLADLTQELEQLWASDKLMILEVFTNKILNADHFKAMKMVFRH